VGQTFTQVEAYITDKDINLEDVTALITGMETAFGDPDRMSTAERKLEALKQKKCNFSTYYVKFQCYTAQV
jgi:hypothetical protein